MKGSAGDFLSNPSRRSPSMAAGSTLLTMSRRSPPARSSSASRRSATSRASGVPLSDTSCRRTSPDHTSSMASASLNGTPRIRPRTRRSITTSRRKSSRERGLLLRLRSSVKVSTIPAISVSVNGATAYSTTSVPKRSVSVSRTICLLSTEATATTLTSLLRAASTK